MAIYFHWEQSTADIWQDAFGTALSHVDLRTEQALGDPKDVQFAVVWAPPKGRLKQFPNLKYIFSIGAGVTHITDDPDTPLHVPIVRLQDDMLVQDMSCHILHWVLHFHRFYDLYKRQQAEKVWKRHLYRDNQERNVVILGLGQTGLDACQRLSDLGFKVTGWSKSQKSLTGVDCLHGEGSLRHALSRASILVNLLPLTPETTDLINKETIEMMPDGAFVINCSRGATIVDDDLRQALNTGKIEAAALDVFRDEPLPQNEWYWTHPKVNVTPHAAAPSNERSAAQFIASHIHRALNGEKPWPIVDLQRGY
ncbi:2-hydroxyacid dehydrogenase [Cochlodiniinecator piscidefendens]|uniref:2-hydroxyacid dehydrogenase n=1 Tax=Cochlodiniinecator piscidefendens TaxID=2715756 RepID=UPI00140C1416|nr:glyoxylate/hydroxypyruvate reductase A [Cochlodiniinecator piscidefendens]